MEDLALPVPSTRPCGASSGRSSGPATADSSLYAPLRTLLSVALEVEQGHIKLDPAPLPRQRPAPAKRQRVSLSAWRHPSPTPHGSHSDDDSYDSSPLAQGRVYARRKRPSPTSTPVQRRARGDSHGDSLSAGLLEDDSVPSSRASVPRPKPPRVRRRRKMSTAVQYPSGGPDDMDNYFLDVAHTRISAEALASVAAKVNRQSHSGKKGKYYSARRHVCTGCKEVFKGGAPLLRKGKVVSDNIYRALRLQCCLDVGMLPTSVGAGAGNHHNHVKRDLHTNSCAVGKRMKAALLVLEAQVLKQE